MRLAIFAPVFVRPSETFIYDAAVELASAGLDVRVIAGRRESERDRPYAPVHVASLPNRKDPARLVRRLLRPVTGASADEDRRAVQERRIRRLVEEIRPDVVLANYGQGGVACAHAAAATGVPLVVSFHGADASRLARKPEWQARFRRMFGIAALVTAPSEYVRQRLIGLGCPESKARVQRYGIRVAGLPDEAPSSRFNGRQVRFLFVGRLTRKKAPVTLLEAFRVARERLAGQRDARLVMIGDGPLKAEVAAAVESLGLADSVDLMGRQPHEEVYRQFQQAHIYVQHSVTAPDGDQEGLPVSITEAMGAGLPVIATRHSGIPEAVIEGECGLLVDEHDVEGMASRMVELALDPARWDAFGAAGRRRLEAEFAMPIVQEKLRGLLAEAAATRVRAA